MIGRRDFVRQRQEQRMDDLCTILKPGTEESKDSFGEVTTPPEEVATGVKCFYYMAGGSEKLVAAGIASIGDFVLGFEGSLKSILTSVMTVVIQAREPYPERAFQLKWVDDDPENVYVRAVGTKSG